MRELSSGCTFDDVIGVTTFHTGPAAQFEIFDPIPKRAFGNGPFPTSTAVGATWICGFDFEIKVIARIRASN